MTTAIHVENLSKRYILSHQRKERYTALRDVIAAGTKRIAYKLVHPFAVPENDPTHEEFWALRDVSFDIHQGDRVGIIGRNGAGKSTLLKVLSRITEPTRGKISIRGRVASLLEVGTGFHPELTGRENIFLNGVILGMSKDEIRKKFDEIVAFAEVERFLDTPVKRYSSGMYVRLAFSVAAHLEPEILIVDEVLAVGDVRFQKKCLGKMEDVGKEGRTVLFVSHNMSTIQQLCNKGIMLRSGTVADAGTIEKVVEAYLSDSAATRGTSVNAIPRTRADYGVIARFVNAWPVNAEGENVSGFRMGETIAFTLQVKVSENVDELSIVAGLDTYMDYRITTVLSEEVGQFYSGGKDEVISIALKFPTLHLKPGTYSLTLGIRRNRRTLDHILKAIQFEVSEITYNRSSRESHLMGDVLAESVWGFA
jgi:lipopolysaccharide transport system ATP-binding protein